LRPASSHQHPLVRRLTRTEWTELKKNGTIPFENAVALLVVPPLNRNPETKKRPTPSMSSLPEGGEVPVLSRQRTALPVSALHLSAQQNADDSKGVGVKLELPRVSIPLYNGVALFPSLGQRAALHQKLNELLMVERRARWRNSTAQEPSRADADAGQKASHAYLLLSDSETILRADSVPLAIALWRVRLWEGGGWTAASARGWRLDSQD